MSERRSRQTRRLPAYVADVVKLGQGLQLRRGSIAYVAVRHDPDCPKLTGGECTCHADVELTRIEPAPEVN